MVKRTVEELSTYNAPGHHGCTCMRYHGKDETGASKFWIGMSVFLPGGGADYAYEDNPLEKVYYVLEGEKLLPIRTARNTSSMQMNPSPSRPTKDVIWRIRPTCLQRCW